MPLPTPPLAGKKFYMLSVLGRTVFSHRRKQKRIMWSCRCDCGNYTTLDTSAIYNRNTGSCGCFKKQVNKSNLLEWTLKRKRHGRSGTPEYQAWKDMQRRCSPDSKSRHYYYDQGIKVCEAWCNHDSFMDFFNHVGLRPEGTSLDRINPYGNYEPGNVRWADKSTQARNQRRYVNTSLITDEALIAELQRRGLTCP